MAFHYTLCHFSGLQISFKLSGVLSGQMCLFFLGPHSCEFWYCWSLGRSLASGDLETDDLFGPTRIVMLGSGSSWVMPSIFFGVLLLAGASEGEWKKQGTRNTQWTRSPGQIVFCIILISSLVLPGLAGSRDIIIP